MGQENYYSLILREMVLSRRVGVYRLRGSRVKRGQHPQCQMGHDGSWHGEKLMDSGCIAEEELTGPLMDEASGVREKKKSKMTPRFSP